MLPTHLLSQRRGIRLVFAVSAGACLLAATAFVAKAEQPPSVPSGEVGKQTASIGLNYDATIEAGDNRDLTDLLMAASYLHSLADRAPATLAGLERRTANDLERLASVLRSEGYYAGDVAAEIDVEAEPVAVAVRVDPGPQYILQAYSVEFSGTGPATPPTLDEIGIDLGAPARAPAIVSAERAITALLAQRGHPFARIVSRDAVVNHDMATMGVDLVVDAGPPTQFGPVIITGLTDVAPDYIDALIDVPVGAPFDRRVLTDLRRTLSRTGLFTAINIETPAELHDGTDYPVTVGVTERPHRSIGAGVNFSTDAGIGGQISWVHRNFFHHGERLRIAVTGNQIEQTAEAGFRKPVFFHPDQILVANVSAGRRETDAFDEEFVDGLVGLERILTEYLRAGLGVSAEVSSVTSSTGKTEFAIFGVPLTLGFDTTADPLDPTRGVRADLSLTPKIGTNSSASSTLTTATTIISASAYYPIDAAGNYVLAGRARVGGVFGEAFDDLPIDQRLFAGGAASIRGFEFQRAGPLDANADPTGGRSALDFGAEFRARFLDNWGLVVFADGGTVSRGQFLAGDERLLLAAGAGARYYTKVGPVRFDIAFPLNGRDGIDDLFQFYVSFGQAF